MFYLRPLNRGGDIHIVYGVPEVGFIDDDDLSALFPQTDGLLDLAAIAGVGPTGITGITHHKVVGFGRNRSADGAAKLGHELGDLRPLGPVEFAGEAKCLALKGDLRTYGTDTTDAVLFPQSGKFLLRQVVGGGKVDDAPKQDHQGLPFPLGDPFVLQDHIEQAVDLIKGVCTGKKLIGVHPRLQGEDLSVTQFAIGHEAMEHTGQELDGRGDHVVVGVVVGEVIAEPQDVFCLLLCYNAILGGPLHHGQDLREGVTVTQVGVELTPVDQLSDLAGIYLHIGIDARYKAPQGVDGFMQLRGLCELAVVL